MKLRRTVKPRSAAACDFFAIGENSVDTIALGATVQGLSAKKTLEQLLELPGGQAATAAVACARLGWRVRYLGVVGDDHAGRLVRQTLSDENVDARLIIRAGSTTRRAVVLVDDKTGDRTVLEHREPRLAFRPDEIGSDLFRDARIVLVDATDPAAARRAAELARAANARTILDADRSTPEVADLLSAVDVVILPAETAMELAGVGELGRALASIGQGSGALAVIGTLGSQGALAWSGDREFRVQAHRVEVVDATGAGDAFRAGFAAAWLGSPDGDPDLEDLLAAGTLVGGLACRGLGAQTSLPRQFEVPAGLQDGV